jgi:hypothetical protein
MSEIERQIRAKLAGLISGDLDVEAVADWATEIREQDDPVLDDDRLWSALDKLSGADSKTGPEEYLYGHEDYVRWLADFDGGIF